MGRGREVIRGICEVVKEGGTNVERGRGENGCRY